MYKFIFILYITCFGLYILFTRQPDYFDGEKAPARIHWLYDSAAGKKIPQAVYHDGLRQHAIDAQYLFRSFAQGDRVAVIYETAAPEKAAVYAFWGYWIGWGELLASVVLCLLLFQVAVVVTANPDTASLTKQLEYREEKKRKYLE